MYVWCRLGGGGSGLNTCLIREEIRSILAEECGVI